MPEDIMQDTYEIKLKLKSDWAAALGKQSRQFESFIQKANTATRSLGKSITGMQTNLAKSYEGMFAGSQKQIRELVGFANFSIKGISASAGKIMSEVERQQGKVDKLITKNIAKIKSYDQASASALKRATVGDSVENKKMAAHFEKISSLLERQVGVMGKKHEKELTRMLGRHFDLFASGLKQKSAAVLGTVRLMVKGAISEYNRVKSQTLVMPKAIGTLRKAEGISAMEKKQKQVSANVKQIEEAHAAAQKVFHEQHMLRLKAKGTKEIEHYQKLENKASAVLKLIAKEMGKTQIKANQFTIAIRNAKEELRRLGGGADVLKQWQAQLDPGRIKSMIKPVMANIAETSKLMSRGLMKDLMASIKKGDALRGKLKAFKDEIVKIKQQAAMLAKMGIIDSNKINPQINAAEQALKKFELQIRKTKQEYAKFAPKKMSKFDAPELGALDKTKEKFQSLMRVLSKFKQINKENFEDLNKQVKKTKSVLEEDAKIRERVEKRITAIKAEVIRVRKQLDNTENKNLRVAIQKYISTLKGKAKEIKEAMSKTVSPLDVKRIKIYEMAMLKAARRIVTQISAITSGTGAARVKPDVLFGNIKKQYEILSKQIDKLRSKKFVSASTIEEGKKKVEKLKESVVSYKKTIIKLGEEYKRLQVLQRAGFTNEGVRRQKALLREQINSMRTHAAEVQRMSHHASRRIEQVQATSLKGFLRRSWEMVRNFRWQVAAVIYLISRAVQAVKRVFLDTMNEIAKFRRDSMALAAQYSFKMFGDMRKNFTQAYQFSRDLMMKLEIVAAETILTLDDMLMLTKTFAQAGIIPRTDEDLHRIATIGTAIKALTEGMANAGVQMKQELYAIIAGRQRATDQLAMMFKLMGKDIQKMIDDGKRQGKEMIEVLADALKPFSVMNEALKDEWEAVINKLQIVWKMLKRFALEDSLLQSTKTLKAFIETFWNKTEGLTEKGRSAAAAVRAGFELVKAVVAAIYGITKEIVITLGSILQITMSMIGVTSQVEGNVAATNAGMKGLLQLMEGLLKVTWLVSETFRMVFITINAVIAPLNYIIEAFKAGGSYAAAWSMRFQSIFVISKKYKQSLREAADIQMELAGSTLSAANKQMNEAGAALVNMIGDADKRYQDVEATVDRILELLNAVNKQNAKLGKEFKLTYPTGVFDEWSKMQGEMQRAEAAQFKGPKRYQIEMNQKIAALDELKMKTKKNLVDLHKMNRAYEEGVFKMTKEQHIEFMRSWEGHKEVIDEVYKYEMFIRAEAARKTEEWNRKEEISLAKKQRKYEQFMREVSQISLTPKEKAQDWYQRMLIDVKELAVTSKFFADNMDKVQEALKGGLKLRDDNAMAKMNLEAEKFINKASKANAWNNVFDNINIEFAEYNRQIEKSVNLEEDKKKELIKQLGLIKQQRSAQETLNLAHESYLSQLELQSKKAAYLQGSYSPIKQRAGEIMALRTTHARSMEDMTKKLDDHNNKWKENGEYKVQATEATKAQGKAMEDMMHQMTIATEREIQKKQIPIWNDLTEASNTWADGFTDALSQVINGVDGVSSALDALQKQILQDTLKILIKNTITDNLQDMLGSGFAGDETLFQKMFGGGKKGKEVTEITATKPIPVYITKMPGNMMEVAMPEMEKSTLLDIGKPIPVYVTNMGAGGVGGVGEGMKGIFGGSEESIGSGVQGVSQDLADISAEIAANTEEASESSDSWLTKIKDGFSGIGDWISGLFGGGAAGGGGGSTGASLMNMGMMAASSYSGYSGGAMADGGVISEPIVGKGLRSGEVYNFGEKTKYGENEIVAPMKKMQRSASRNKTEYHMPIHLSAIDTQSGIQFLVKHSDVIQGQLVKNLKQNKPIRKGIQNAY